MERELYSQLYQIVYQLARGSRTKRVLFPDRVIVLTYFWAVLHDRPVAWACCDHNWPMRTGRPPLPSASTMSRRLRRPPVLDLIQRAEQSVMARLPRSDLCFIDAKPLSIGSASGDPDAQWGYAAGRINKGYKLHAILDAKRVVRCWEIRPMRPREAAVAPELIEQLDGSGTLVGDNAYDTNALYDLVHRHRWQLFAPRRANTKLDVTDKRHSPYRLAAHRPADRKRRELLYRQRSTIERFFAQLGNQCGGLGPLPNHVRRLRRVRLWVQAKLILYHVRMLKMAA
jgi:hypothetical protein